MKLAGYTALVTGASRGIGQAIALGFAAEGAHIALTGRDTEGLARTEAQIRALGVNTTTIAADLAEPSAARRVFDHTTQALGRIDILVNNAGIGSSIDPQPLISYHDATWDLLLYVNLTVPYLLTKWALPSMVDHQFGRIINIASINSYVPSMHGVAYTASKHGLLGLTKNTALELAGTGITANAICPGPVHTRTNDIRVAYDAQRLGRSFAEQEATVTPMGRRLEPDELTPLAVYLASRESAMVTGQAFIIDGGAMMR